MRLDEQRVREIVREELQKVFKEAAAETTAAMEKVFIQASRSDFAAHQKPSE